MGRRVPGPEEGFPRARRETKSGTCREVQSGPRACCEVAEREAAHKICVCDGWDEGAGAAGNAPGRRRPGAYWPAATHSSIFGSEKMRESLQTRSARLVRPIPSGIEERTMPGARRTACCPGRTRCRREHERSGVECRAGEPQDAARCRSAHLGCCRELPRWTWHSTSNAYWAHASCSACSRQGCVV